MVKSLWEVKKYADFSSGERLKFPFMPWTHALRFAFKIYSFCTSWQILELWTCNFSHLSHEAAVKENSPFVRTCTYWSQQVKRSEAVIYTFFCKLWKQREDCLTLLQQAWNYPSKRILLHGVFIANPAWGKTSELKESEESAYKYTLTIPIFTLKL